MFRNYRSRIGIGMVPWLTHPEVARLLARLDGMCVIVDKGQRSQALAGQLNEDGHSLPAAWLGLDYLGAPDADGRPPLIHPSSGSMPGEETLVGPVRSAGFRLRQRDAPLVHAKMLVLCHTDQLDYGEGWDGRYLRPVKVWLGSANWTANAPAHLEFGLWSSDPELVRASLEFLRDVVRVSEPFGSTAPRPEPEFVDADWDDDAFAEAALQDDDVDGPLDE